jgi:hypothetical protein
MGFANFKGGGFDFSPIPDSEEITTQFACEFPLRDRTTGLAERSFVIAEHKTGYQRRDIAPTAASIQERI